MNYIGIRGHRGAGKKTVAYLLGETLNYILQKKKGDKILNYEEEFKELFKNWCNSIKNNEEIIDNVDLEKYTSKTLVTALRLSYICFSVVTVSMYMMITAKII